MQQAVDWPHLQQELDQLKSENRQLKMALQERKQWIGVLETRIHADNRKSDDVLLHRPEEDLGVEGVDWIAGTPQIKHESSRKRCRYNNVSWMLQFN